MTELLPAEDLANSPGFVSPHCRCSVTDGVCFITVGGQLMGAYELEDKTAQRSLWVQVYRAGHATQVQIARYLKIGLRTFHGWVSRYRQEGMAGLSDRPKSGRPPAADESKKKLVRQARAAGQTVYEIARMTNLSASTINRIVGRKQPPVVEGPALNLEPEGVAVPESAVRTASWAPAEVAVSVLPVVEAAAITAPVAQAQSGAVGTGMPAVATEGIPMAVEPVVAVSATAASANLGTDVELSSSRTGVDPMDRWEDRMLARMGLLEDAAPVFAPGVNLPWVGVFLGLALLGKDPLLPVARRVFGSLLGSAFYGLRTVLVTLVVLAWLRIKRPEQLRQHQAPGLGQVLGLDRVLEVKALRRKLHVLSPPLLGAQFMEELARERAAGYEQPVRVVYVDGHVEVYSGQYPIGQVYAASRSRVVKGTTRTWVNLPGAKPLFCVSSEFNEGLVAALPKVVSKVQEVLGTGPLIEVFDRGGYCGRLFEQQLAAGHTIITYRRGKYAEWPLEKFEKKETRIGSRTYAYAPAEAEVEIPVHQDTPGATGQKGAPAQGKTGRTVRLREIRVVREDGRQTSVLAGNTQAPAVEVCALLFGRWGAQENVFKYLLAEYDLDATVEYGDEPLSERITHPNPEGVKKRKALAKEVAKRDRLLAKLGIKLTVEPLDAEALAKQLAQWQRRPQAAKVQAAQTRIDQLRQELAQLPERVPAGQSGLRRLKSEMKLLTTALKLTAYDVETQLLERIRPHFRPHAKEGRKLIVAALRSPGSIRLQPGQIRVKLAPQSSPHRTRAVAKLCESLNELKPVYPGTELQIVFENPLD
jgi:transposase